MVEGVIKDVPHEILRRGESELNVPFLLLNAQITTGARAPNSASPPDPPARCRPSPGLAPARLQQPQVGPCRGAKRWRLRSPWLDHVLQPSEKTHKCLTFISVIRN